MAIGKHWELDQFHHDETALIEVVHRKGQAPDHPRAEAWLRR
jgi:hypothetical protein